MDAIRTSASDIDALRYFRSDEDGDMDALLRRLRRQEEPNELMRAGTALHKALELAPVGDVEALEADGYTFAFADDVEMYLPPVRELKTTREYVVDGCIVTIAAVTDAIDGRRISDHKMTTRYDAERFLGSYQHRIYLDVFEADLFTWNVFEVREIEPKQYRVTATHQLRAYRYPGLRDDVVREIGRFVDFARKFLPERVQVAA